MNNLFSGFDLSVTTPKPKVSPDVLIKKAIPVQTVQSNNVTNEVLTADLIELVQIYDFIVSFQIMCNINKNLIY